MNIWVFNHYAEGREGYATRPYDIARRVIERGHRVTIFASSFNHYSFRETRLDGIHLWRSETIDGVEFVWLRTFPYRWNDWRRILNMGSYFLMALVTGLRRSDTPDAIIGVSVHPLAALAAQIVASRRRCRFFFEVTDLWPQTLIEFGRISAKGVTARSLRALEGFLYRHAEKIFMLWRNTHDYVTSIGADADKIVWLPHAADLDRYADLPPYHGLARQPFTVMYLGGFVENNDIHTIIESARELRRRGRSDIVFALVGSSTHKAAWVDRVVELDLKNVVFPPPVPKADIARVMRDADAFIYAVRDLPIYRFGISMNKLVDYLAAGRPIIFAGHSAYDPVLEAEAGFSVPPENPQALADAVERLVALQPEERARMGRRARNHLDQHHTLQVVVNRLLKALGCAEE